MVEVAAVRARHHGDRIDAVVFVEASCASAAAGGHSGSVHFIGGVVVEGLHNY